MRKIFSLIVFLMVAGLFAAPVFASNSEEECGDLKGATKGLYGLCIAYQNAENPNARDRILANYNKKAEAGDPPMPGTGAACPCFGVSEVAEAGLNHDPIACGQSASGSGVQYSIYLSGFVDFNVNGVTASCFHNHNPGPEDPNPSYNNDFSGLSSDEVQACRDVIDGAIDMDFGDFVCESTP